MTAVDRGFHRVNLADCLKAGINVTKPVVGALGGDASKVKFTTAVRPRTGNEVPICPSCESSYGRSAFPREARFKTDE